MLADGRLEPCGIADSSLWPCLQKNIHGGKDVFQHSASYCLVGLPLRHLEHLLRSNGLYMTINQDAPGFWLVQRLHRLNNDNTDFIKIYLDTKIIM